MRYYNPEHPKWRYKISRKEWLNKKRERDKCKELFIAGNHYAHRMAERCKDLEELKKLVLKDVKYQNMPGLRTYKDPLPKEDVKAIAEKLAVSAWDWQQKKISDGTARKINFGAMGFPKMRRLDRGAYYEETKKRQQLSARRTHAIRRFKTEENIMYAIFKCTANEIKVTKTQIAKMVGIRREELSKRYDSCFEGKTTLCIHQNTHPKGGFNGLITTGKNMQLKM